MIKKRAVNLINIYQNSLSFFLKQLLGTSNFCRFEETCSMYTKRSIAEEGFLKGVYLGLKRLLKCQPFYKGSLVREEVL